MHVKKKTSSFISFLIYYILKNHATWLADSIFAHNSRTRILPDMWLVVNIKDNISFHFRLFSTKTNHKIYQKFKKIHFGAILGSFCPTLNFPGKKLSVFRYSNYLPSCQKSEKTIDQFLRKTLHWQKDRGTDRQQWFYRTIHRIGVQ